MGTQVDMNFLPEIILVDSYWELAHKLECVKKKKFLSPSIWAIPVNNSVEITKPKIWGWGKRLLCCPFIFTHLSPFSPSNNIVSNYLTNNVLLPPV
jgi:hypothetical protein